MKYNSIPELFYRKCNDINNKKPAFKYKFEGKFIDLEHSKLLDIVENLTVALMSLGIHKGDRVGIISENRIEWIIFSFAINSIGAVDVPIFPILTAKQAEFIYNDCNATAIVVSNNFQLNKVLQFKDKIESLRHIIIMNEDFDSKEVYIKTMNGLIKRALEIKSKNEIKEIFFNSISKIQSDDLLTVIYTSGTTGNPKGVMLTHKNLLSNIEAAQLVLPQLGSYTSLLFLPLNHSYERLAGFYTLFASGTLIAIAESVDSVPANILEIKPHIMTTVPKLLETIRKKILLNMEKEKTSKKSIFNWAIKVGIKKVRMEQLGKTGLKNSIEYRLADKLVFSKLREKMGGNLELFVSGGAALSTEVSEFFMAIGLTVLQGYGLTEASPCISINTYDNLEIGTIGPPLFNVEVKLAEDGEILARGPSIMKGYWNDPIATKEAIDEEGWLYTGDIGVITEKGSLKITDRKKNIFVSSGGKNIVPAPIENLILQSKYVENCILIGENREFITALLTPDLNQIKLLAEEFAITFDNEKDLLANPKIIKHIQRDLDYLQRDLSKYEKVRKFHILTEPFTVDGGELSPKMSIKRHVVERKYSDLIEMMYK